MEFDLNNHIVQLCTQGMELEGKGEKQKALNLFMQAWNEASNDFERFIAAHYVARHQKTINDKLNWDNLSLKLALKFNDQNIKQSFPSLYLNIAKGYEDLNDFEKAIENYRLALSFIGYLPDNGYGKMIRSGIKEGLLRVNKD